MIIATGGYFSSAVFQVQSSSRPRAGRSGPSPPNLNQHHLTVYKLPATSCNLQGTCTSSCYSLATCLSTARAHDGCALECSSSCTRCLWWYLRRNHRQSPAPVHPRGTMYYVRPYPTCQTTPFSPLLWLIICIPDGPLAICPPIVTFSLLQSSPQLGLASPYTFFTSL